MLGIIGNGTVGNSFLRCLETRGVPRTSVVCYDTDPARTSLDRAGFAEAAEDLQIIFVCVPTPRRAERTRPDHRYDLSAVMDAMRLLAESSFEGILMLRTVVSPADYALLEDTRTSLGAVFMLCACPALLDSENAAGSAFQPPVMMYGLSPEAMKDERSALIEHFHAEVFPDTKVLKATATSVLILSQMASVYQVVHAVLLQEMDTVWQALLGEERDASMEETLHIIKDCGLFQQRFSLYDPADGNKGVAHSHYSEDLAAVCWAATMKEVLCPTLQAANRQVARRNKE